MWYFVLVLFDDKSRFWIPMFFIGVMSPLVDPVYNYQGGLWREASDVWDLFDTLPDILVHAYFVVAIAICIVGVYKLRTRRN